MLRSALIAAPLALLAAAPSAHAANRFTLDTHPATPAHVLMNPPGFDGGSALVAWTSGASFTPKVCVIPPGGTCAEPQTLQLPGGGPIDGLFPVVHGGTVTLVGPRDIQQDVVRWTAQDDGTFGPGGAIGGAYLGMTSPQDVIALGADTLIGAVNPGLGIAGFGAEKGRFAFSAPGTDVKASSLALDARDNPVSAYFTLDGTIRATRYRSEGPHFVERNWTAPAPVAAGTEPVLTGGTSGLFMASQDGTRLDLRRDAGDAFGAPRTLADDPAAELFDAGAATQSPGGRIAVLWPAHRADGQKVLRLYASADGGESFAHSDVATIGDTYLVDRNASAGMGDDSQGIATFVDGGGLEVADLSPLAAPAPPPPPPVPTPVPTPPPCRNGSVSAHLRNALVTLRATHLPDGVVVAQVTVRSRRYLRLRVRFRYDGRPARARTRLSALLHARPGTTHTLIARVYARGLERTLRLTVIGCGG